MKITCTSMAQLDSRACYNMKESNVTYDLVTLVSFASAITASFTVITVKPSSFSPVVMSTFHKMSH